jgi:hypothetical protein
VDFNVQVTLVGFTAVVAAAAAVCCVTLRIHITFTHITLTHIALTYIALAGGVCPSPREQRPGASRHNGRGRG